MATSSSMYAGKEPLTGTAVELTRSMVGSAVLSEVLSESLAPLCLVVRSEVLSEVLSGDTAFGKAAAFGREAGLLFRGGDAFRGGGAVLFRRGDAALPLAAARACLSWRAVLTRTFSLGTPRPALRCSWLLPLAASRDPLAGLSSSSASDAVPSLATAASLAGACLFG
mmetsp:Transcript_87030/g.231281  ORF Transcript_87030/g.231281 Transcript_87030/m.231281 type:complete len:168 (+) Transcript_87030:129-632(+)